MAGMLSSNRTLCISGSNSAIWVSCEITCLLTRESCALTLPPTYTSGRLMSRELISAPLVKGFLSSRRSGSEIKYSICSCVVIIYCFSIWLIFFITIISFVSWYFFVKFIRPHIALKTLASFITTGKYAILIYF